jgi:multidrug efflux pump subunit AcrA (membrane-fusion protein)
MSNAFQKSWRDRRGITIAVLTVLAVVLCFAGFKLFDSRASAASISAPAGIPTGLVTKGDLVDTVELRGQIRAARSVSLNAPSNAGDIQIIRLAKNGSTVHKGDVVIAFDTAMLEITLSQRRSDFKQAQAQVEDARAKARLTAQQDQTDLMTSTYDVERAKLEASKAEILSAIDGEEKKLLLADAEQKLKQVQTKADSDKHSSEADISSILQKQQKADRDVKQYEDRIAQMVVRAPVDGTMIMLPNYRAGGAFGMSAPEFKEGDRAWAGAEIAQLPDLGTMYFSGRVDESDRGRLQPGETVSSRVDAVPDLEFAGTVGEISPLAKPDYSSWPPTKNFDLAVALSHPDPRVRPGMSTTLRIAVDRIPNVIVAPSAAVFTRNGHSVVYVSQAGSASSKFEERQVVIGHRGSGQAEVISGLKPGERVALRDPLAAVNP